MEQQKFEGVMLYPLPIRDALRRVSLGSKPSGRTGLADFLLREESKLFEFLDKL